MKAKLLTLLVIFLASPVGEALACAVCYGARDSKSTENMAIAVWVMMGVVMSVLGGVGAFSLHLWRHAHTPLEPHEELVEENLEQYE
jgi:putative Mn2+ efflux pump MntP